MGYYVPKEKPLCYKCQFRTGNYCGILTENEGVKDYVGTYKENPRCPLVEMEEPQTWIPVSERLPDVRQWVLCQCRAGIMDVLRLTEDGSWNKNYPHTEYMSSFVTAWMPLPKAYEVKE